MLTVTGYSNATADRNNSGSGSDDRLIFAGNQTANHGDLNFGWGTGVGGLEVTFDSGFCWRA